MPNFLDNSQKDEIRPGYRRIYRASRKDEDGNIIYARDYGLRGFPIWVKDDKVR